MDWNIQSRSKNCKQCKKPFQEKEEFHTFLYRTKGNMYERMDICESCWLDKFNNSEDVKKNCISYWKSRYITPPPPPPEPIQKDTAESLLRNILNMNLTQYSAVAYVLSIMLERKRVLKPKSRAVEDDRIIWVYEHTKTGEVFCIAEPNLDPKQFEAVQQQVTNLLTHGIPKSSDLTNTPDQGNTDIGQSTPS